MGFKSSQISKSKACTGHYASRFFFIHGISKFNEENREKICLFEFFKKLLDYNMITSKKYFPIFLIHMQMGNSFNLISINVVPIHRVII